MEGGGYRARIKESDSESEAVCSPESLLSSACSWHWPPRLGPGPGVIPPGIPRPLTRLVP